MTRQRPLACHDCDRSDVLVHMSGYCNDCAKRRAQKWRAAGGQHARPARCSSCGGVEQVGRSGYCNMCQTARTRARRAANPEAVRESERGYYAAHRERRKQTTGERNRMIRAEVMAAYGNACACCGETIPEFLTIDHPNVDGSEHRFSINTHGGFGFYKWLRAHGFPTGYRVLCFNCNLSIQYRGAICPHERLRATG